MARRTRATPRKPKLTRRLNFWRSPLTKRLAPNTIRNRPSRIEDAAQIAKCCRASRAPANNKRKPIAILTLPQVLDTERNLAPRRPPVNQRSPQWEILNKSRKLDKL